MKFENEFPSLSKERSIDVKGKSIHHPMNIIVKTYGTISIQEHCLDKAKIKEALTGTRKNINEQYGWVKVDKKKWDELRI